MFSGSLISQRLRVHHSLQLGFYGWSNCQCYRTLEPSVHRTSPLLSFFRFPFRSVVKLYNSHFVPPRDFSDQIIVRLSSLFFSASPSPHPSVSNISNDEDPVPVSFINSENCVRSAMHQPPLLSGCLSPAGDVPGPPSARLSPVAGGIVALGKFDALHTGHRELAIQAAKIGVPFLLSFVGIAEILGWEPRAPIVAKCDRKRILSSWGLLCRNVIPKEFQIEFSKVRYLTLRQFVEKLSEVKTTGSDTKPLVMHQTWCNCVPSLA